MSSVHCMAGGTKGGASLARPRTRLWHTHAFRTPARPVSSYELFIGLRYTRARQRTRFISVISLISIVGIALGMTVLITVLSVFNGFQREVRTRMLGAIAHAQVTGDNDTLDDWQKIAAIVKQHPEVKAVAP